MVERRKNKGRMEDQARGLVKGLETEAEQMELKTTKAELETTAGYGTTAVQAELKTMLKLQQRAPKVY